ncbi:hypothetical protein M0804_004692 [Polistes exclamans]|nr:hypothetical protein M0804_004692 [Polistes exclamans]
MGACCAIPMFYQTSGNVFVGRIVLGLWGFKSKNVMRKGGEQPQPRQVNTILGPAKNFTPHETQSTVRIP